MLGGLCPLTEPVPVHEGRGLPGEPTIGSRVAFSFATVCRIVQTVCMSNTELALTNVAANTNRGEAQVVAWMD